MRYAPSPAHFVWAAIIAIGLLLVILALPVLQITRQPEDDTSALQRQRVVIFIIDTSGYFDAHGAHVQSIISRRCSTCMVRQVNLHGDIGIPSILQALQHVQEVSRTFDDATTVLVNISLGTYTYDRVLHAMIRALEAQKRLVIASAGNDNTTRPFYPAAFEEVLGICSSTRYRKTKTPYSNFGAWVSLCAPGLQYVTRPWQPGALAQGTSFSSPMVTGVLGQLFLDAPCASTRIGVRALLRTADPIASAGPLAHIGVLNPRAAAHYLRTLHGCQAAESFTQRALYRMRRFGTDAVTSLGLIAYALVSIFALPFLFAFVLEHIERRVAQRRQRIIQLAYTGSPDYRRERLLRFKRRLQRTGNVRRRHQDEVVALVQALHQYGEPCWWCDRPATAPPADLLPEAEIAICSRCGTVPYVRY